MRKSLDWNATESRAKAMEDSALWAAYLDCISTAKVWDAAGEGEDPDGNSGFYHDEASVYYRERLSRR